MADALRSVGYVVEEVSTAVEAIGRFRSSVPPKLFVADMDLDAGETGQTLSTSAKMMAPGMPVLFITNCAERLPAEASDQHPSVLLKPFQTGQLVTRVQQMANSMS
jgi:CheY-like chemotaxis protein